MVGNILYIYIYSRNNIAPVYRLYLIIIPYWFPLIFGNLLHHLLTILTIKVFGKRTFNTHFTLITATVKPVVTYSSFCNLTYRMLPNGALLCNHTTFVCPKVKQRKAFHPHILGIT